MPKQRLFLPIHRILLLLLLGMVVLGLPRAFQHSSSAAGSPHKVHIAFGFHVNLYHSFRGDTNDENGFGQDIRVIRHTISVLDRFNRRGIPVRAVWDFDNLFSLEEILPVHAPDIIDSVQRRVRENGDDVILMSFNNGMASAMNHEEFMASIQQGISNAAGSGVQDLFGRLTPVVRPQEMMTTPGHFERYRQFGIEYVSLYYSATPFDAFRVFARELSPAEAHNPVQYHNLRTGERIGIVPTYHAGDLVEHVSLRDWAEQLHQLQNEGRIDRDVLIFINFDADAEFWTGADLPWHLDWLPNTGGIEQLVESVADLDFVAFSNLSDYLADHPPQGSVHFGQDTADGSFNGYHSWAEKAYASDYWTRIVKNRRADQTAAAVFTALGVDPIPHEFQKMQRAAFETRMRALSTTNFGLAAPFLARQREAAMAALLERLDGYTEGMRARLAAHVESVLARATPPDLPAGAGCVVEPFLYLDSDAGADRSFALTLPHEMSGSGAYFLADAGGRIIPAMMVKRVDHPERGLATVTLRVFMGHDMPDGIYFLCRRKAAPETADGRLMAGPRVLKNEFIEVRFNDQGHVTRLVQNGLDQLDARSLSPYILYEGRRNSPERLTVTPEQTGTGGVAAVRIHGPWQGPPGTTRRPGWVDYRLRLLRGVPYLFVEGEVRYPDTYRRHTLQADKPMLARKIDAGWEAVAPLELRFAARATTAQPFLIHKRNYLGKEDAYAVDYHRHAPENLNVASINNHVTPEYAAVTGGGRGMAVAMNPEVNANFAFCPFRLTHLPATNQFSIRANPFGTYDGHQVVPPTWGNRQGYDAVLLSAPQLRSAGPTYNGYGERFELMVSFFDGDAIPEGVKRDLIAFANRPVTIGLRQSPAPVNTADRPLPPDGLLALPYGDGILFHWEETAGDGRRYRIRCCALPEAGERVFSATGGTRFVKGSDLPASGGVLAATVEAVATDGGSWQPSPEIRFSPDQSSVRPQEIPVAFAAKVLWANVNAWIQRHLTI